ncbi:MAG: hypothetical protein B6I35_01355 [Anaerolineaceae bacterium 4572_32.2]|nr:MAG: hypothetical protein B6I35_01355 [Anaerolineaceae bacterium 4572_32.2]HEY71947.1 protein kinase [Thermoflexia bacterium]
MPFTNGENVGAYRIVEKLGQGGMATVFKAYHPALDRYVAIKVMHPAFAGDPNFLARFQREARIVAKLDHPHVVPIYDYSSHRGHPYLVMRFVAGETLKARMERGALDIQEVLRIAQAVGQALTYAHGQGVLHRDIKPSNILLTPDGGVYLTDFGLARMAEAGESTLSRDMMLGTPQYVAPEQAKGIKELDARTDVYSLGVVLYELLVGRPPFVADTPFAVIHDHIFTPLPLPSELNPDLPEPAQRLLLKALAKEPDDRFQSVEELTNALDTSLKPTLTSTPAETVAASSETIVVPPPQVEAVERIQVRKEKQKPKKSRPWLWAVAGAAALLCLIVIALFLTRGLRQRRAVEPPTVEQADVIPMPENIEQLLEDARVAGEEGNFEGALELYRQAMDTDPHLIPAYMGASELLIKMDNIDQAIQVLNKGIRANPDDPLLHKRLAGIGLLTEGWDVAEKESRWLLQEMPEDAFSHTYAAVLMLAQEHPCEEARPELEAALALDPELAWTHYGLALCALQERNVNEARAELEFVLGQDNTPPLLRARAEQKLNMLDQREPGAIEREFNELISIANEIPRQDLRRPLKEMLDHARRIWEQGDKNGAIQILEETRGWVHENWDELGEPLAGDLSARLDNIIHMALELGQP